MGKKTLIPEEKWEGLRHAMEEAAGTRKAPGAPGPLLPAERETAKPGPGKKRGKREEGKKGKTGKKDKDPDTEETKKKKKRKKKDKKGKKKGKKGKKNKKGRKGKG
jgi:hypothetical protein